MDHVEVPAHAAVHVVQDHALLGHVVFDDNDAIGAQALLAAPQEPGQVLISEVAWGQQRLGSRGRKRRQARMCHWPCLSLRSDLLSSVNTRGLPRARQSGEAYQIPVRVRGSRLRNHSPKGCHKVRSWDCTLTRQLLGPARHLRSRPSPSLMPGLGGAYQTVPSLIRTPGRLLGTTKYRARPSVSPAGLWCLLLSGWPTAGTVARLPGQQPRKSTLGVLLG